MNTNEFKNIAKKGPDDRTAIDLGPVGLGGDSFVIFAGPCRVESRTQIMEAAQGIKEAGGHVLRAGAFKPCTHPHCDWGRGETALRELREAGDTYQIPVITEAMSRSQLPLVHEYSDIIQIGTRNAQNYELLRELGEYPKPTMLKRGTWMNLRETLCQAEWAYFADPARGVSGNPQIFMCERGSVHFNDHMRWTLDLAMIPSFKQVSHLPIIVDISHGTGGPGNTAYYRDLARAAVAVGADGMMVEVHPDPARSMSDADQTISLKEFAGLVDAIRPVAAAVGKQV